MKSSKQPLNELDLSTYMYLFGAGKAIAWAAGGVGAAAAIRKVIKAFGTRYKSGKGFFGLLRDPKKLKQAGVSPDEMRALYANGGEALVNLGKEFSKEVFEKVKAGKITPEQAINDLDGIIPESAKQAWLKKFKTIHPGSGAAASTLKATYTKVVGSVLPKDEAFKQAVIKVYGLGGNVDGAYRAYQNAMQSNKLAIPFKNKAVFPSKEDWLAATGYQPKNPNLGFNEKLLQQNNAYKWHKLIWTLYR
jgi:hypothetical protein